MKKKSAAIVIGETLCMDYKDVSEYRYQRYTNPLVFNLGDRYYAVHQTKPKHTDVGATDWVKNADQFGARDTDRFVWVCNAK